MKSAFILMAFFISIQLGYAQTDSVTVEYSTDSVTSKDYNIGRKYKYLDRNFIEEKQMIRFGGSYGKNVNLFLDYEQKLGLSSSMSTGINLNSYNNLSINTEYKFFYSSRRKIKAGEKANNLNGTYISAKYSYILYQDFPYAYEFGNNTFDLTWGYQQRLGRRGFFGIGAGFEFTPKERSLWYIDSSITSVSNWFNFHSQFKIAFAIGNISPTNTAPISYLDQIKSKMSKATNLLQEDKTFFKFGLTNFYLSALSYSIRGTIALEQKIKPSVSFLAEYNYDFSSNFNQNAIYHSNSLNAGFRYYYSMQKRMSRGKSANNFSANYISLMALNLKSSTGYLNSNYKSPQPENDFGKGVGLFWGMQRKIEKIGFLDFNFGFSYKPSTQQKITQYNGNVKYVTKTIYNFYPELRLIYGIGK